ncbi:hypothetical protein HYH03_001327 [Edaphochlamys debaryana]|uniref:SSD domain-containing protein n=1 Tax=Edaphochlamys debaryana TaxID=47281 RepID=A0A835YGK4_9CHLO|nr:hypothetical protein HYH03_001327 [Edaphochlamys debaryana]|eukprot:KAG2500556.1 hypothetical protein HYH03_001327 [Edaphochlamys debaryana]
MRCLRKVSSAVDRGFTRFYRWLGVRVARRPWLVISLAALVTLACCAGFIKFSVEEDAEKLYTPQNAPSFTDKEYVEAAYPVDSLQVKLLALAAGQTGANILSKPYLQEHLASYLTVTNQTVVVDGKSYTWTQVCETVSPTNPECRVDSILRFWAYDPARLAADNNILDTINNRSVTDYLGRSISLDWVLGGVRRDATGAVVAAEVFQTVMDLRYDPPEGEKDDEVSIEYQKRITEVGYDTYRGPLLEQFVSCVGAIGRESSEAINSDVSRLSVGYILLIIYTIVVLYRNSWAYQKAHVALGSFLAIGMGIAADFGMLSGFGVTFNFVCQVLPFLLVGVGVDNTFVIVSNYFDQDPDAPIEHRMGEAMALAGSSITVSCMTNVIAFAVGAYTNLEALLSFSIYASVGTLCVFILQVTVFPAFLALDARRELRKRLSKGGCCGCAAPGPCCTDPAADELTLGANGWTLQNNIYKHDHDLTDLVAARADSGSRVGVERGGSGGGAEGEAPGQVAASRGGSGNLKHAASSSDLAVKVVVRPASPEGRAALEKQLSSQKSAGVLGRDFTTPTIFGCLCLGKTFNPHDDQLSTRLVARWLPAVSLRTWGKVLVLILEAVFLGFAIYGCTKVYMDFNFRELFVPEGNWLHSAFAVEDRYFGGEKVPVAAYTRNTTDGRSYFYYQDQLAALSVDLLANPYITDSPRINSWYDRFQTYINSPVSPYTGQLVAGRAPNETAFEAWVQAWLAGPGVGNTENVLISNTTGRIYASRIIAFTEDVVDGSWAVRCVDSVRATVEAAAPGLDVIAFGPSFTFWDGFRTISRSTVINVVIAACAVFLVTLLLLADIIAALVVGTMVVLCDVGVFGFMYYAGLTFNSVTCIVLVLAVGIAVDYSAHVMRAFLVSTGTRQERAHKALIEIGGAVWNGAVTTFLAVLPMAVAKHYIFTTIFKMFAVLILLAIWHGLVLLPILLSWVGPPSYRDMDGEEEEGKAFTRFYQWLGVRVARRPWLVITIAALVTAACCAGFIRFEVEDDSEKLYTPQNAPSFTDRRYVDAFYSADSVQIKLLALAAGQTGANILSKPYLQEHLASYLTVTNQTVKVGRWSYSWTQLCERVSPYSFECRVDSILRFWAYDPARLAADNNILATINNSSMTDYLGRSISLDWVLGGVRRDASGAVVAAEAFQTVLNLQYDLPEFQERVTQVGYYDYRGPLLKQFVSSDDAIDRESTKAINSDVSRLSVGYILLIIYTIVVLYRNSWAYQKAHVALGSLIAIGMGVAADFGMLSGFGVDFNFVCQVLPFLLVGVGVDNTFVIVSNYFDQDPDAPIEHRMGEALALAGSSITVSCMTNVIAFAVGAYTNLEALLSFSIYASVGTLCVFILQVTVFPAFLALDARRELRKRLSKGGCCGCAAPGPCAKDPAAEELEHGVRGWTLQTNVYKHARASSDRRVDEEAQAQRGDNGGSTEGEAPGQVAASRGGSGNLKHATSSGDLAVKVVVRPASPEGRAALEKQLSSQKSAGVLGRDFTTPTIFGCLCLGKTFNPHADQLSTRLVARWLPAVSLRTWGKVLVLILEAVFLGFAIYGCTKVYMDFNFRELFVPEGNWLHSAFAVEDRCFGGEKVPVAAYTRNTTDGRSYFHYQDQLAALSVDLLANPYITDSPRINSWYDRFQTYISGPSFPYTGQLVAGRAPNETAFEAWVQDGSWAVRCVDSVRATVEAAAPGLDPIAYGPSFTFWDGFRTISKSTVVNVVIAACAVFLVTLLLLADIVAALVVGTMVVLCDVGVFGFMYYAGLTFNSVTCIVLVLAVGIAVDYSAHVMRAFLVSTGTRQERAHKALIEIGGAVWNGAVTTFLAVLPMAAANHYIFTTIFKMFAVLVLLAIWHGLVLLPILLSWLGPPSYRDMDGEEEGKGKGGDEAAAAQTV